MHTPEGFFEEHNVTPSDEAAFKFFYEQTAKEGIAVQPEFAWAQFHGGIAPFNYQSLELVDALAGGLIPNYTKQSLEENNAYPAVPVLDSLSEGFINNLNKARGNMAIRVVGIHPTLASPLLYARAIGAGFDKYLDIDIREQLHITYGAYPTTMRYDFGHNITASPTDIGRTLGNIMLTAPRTDNTITKDELVNSWMTKTRQEFRLNNHNVLQKAGNILIVIPSGRRGVHSKATRPPYLHKEFLPDGKIDYITDYDNPTFVMGVDDKLLVDQDRPGSIVNIAAATSPYRIKSFKQLRDALVHSANLVNTQDTQYSVEGITDHHIRTGKDKAGRAYRRMRGEQKSTEQVQE